MIVRRRRLWLVLLVGFALAGGVWVWAIGNSLSLKDCGRIDYGMTRDQVIATLGRPPIETAVGLSRYGVTGDIWEVSDGQIVIGYGYSGVTAIMQWDEGGLMRCQWKRLLARFGF